MVFNYSTDSGCLANTASGAYNPTPVDYTTSPRATHINEVRKAVEEWYSQNSISPWSWTTPANVTLEKVPPRTAHINELRLAINKVRANVQACNCNSQDTCGHCCACHGWNTFVCGGCACNTQTCNVINTWFSTLSSYAWSQDTGDTSGAGTRVSGGEIYTGFIKDLHDAISDINDDSVCGGRNLSGWGQTF